MALSLAPELLAAQTSLNRNPVIELNAGKSVSDYPLAGNFMTNTDSQNQKSPSMLEKADGSLVYFYAGRGNNGDYKQGRLIFSDPNKETFGNFTQVFMYTYHWVVDQQMIFLDEAENIGIVAVLKNGNETDLRAFRLSPTGTVLNSVLITSRYLTADVVSGITVVKLPNGTFACVYCYNNAGTYEFRLHTSSDFITWSSYTVLNIPGLNNAYQICDPRLIVVDSSDILLFFSYANIQVAGGEIYNIFMSISADLSTWSTVQAVTNTSQRQQDYYNPDVVQREDGRLFVSVQEANGYLQMSSSTPGLVMGNYQSNDFTPTNMWINPEDGKLYLVCTYIGAGLDKTFKYAVRINLDTWEIEKCYNWNTNPAVPLHFRSAVMHRARCYGEKTFAVISTNDAVCLIDFATDTIKSFYFYDRSAQFGPEAAKNVNWTKFMSGQFSENLNGAWIDTARNRLWCFLPNSYYYNSEMHMGYIDLSQSGPTYDWTPVIQGNVVSGSFWWNNHYHVYPEQDIFLQTGAAELDNYAGGLVVWIMSENALYKFYRYADYPSFPRRGFLDCILIGDKIYATVCYSGYLYSYEQYKHGIAEIDLNTDQIIYHYFPYSDTQMSTNTDSLYGRISLLPNSTELLINATFKYPVVFNYETKQFTYKQYEEDIPGSWPPTSLTPHTIIYDPYRNAWLAGIDHNRLYFIPRDGTANILKYIIGELTDQWNFNSPTRMVHGFTAQNPTIMLSAENEIYAVWEDTSLAKQTIKWDKDSASLSLVNYLLGEVAVSWSLDGEPQSLEITLSHGHLFDPQNANSIVNFYMRKGNKLTLAFGENINSVLYVIQQGEFIITETSIDYTRGDYPIISVKARDRRVFWDVQTVIATTVDSLLPHAAIQYVIQQETNETNDKFDLPTFTDGFAFDAQWTDTALKDIIDQIANRFKYFLCMDIYGRLSAKRINLNAAVSTTYSNKDLIITVSPDDTYSDFVNRILVTGESQQEIEVLFSEERLASLSGTVGWWGFRKDFDIYYSEDQTKRAKWPRLKVIETATSILFHLAGKIRERIRFIDVVENSYCVVEVSAPNLVPILLSAIAMYAAGNMIGDAWGGFGGGLTQPVGRKLESAGIMLALMVLGSTGNFQYEIWGQPIGYVRRQVSNEANDFEMQLQMGEVITNKMEGFLCYTAAQCLYVAEFELGIAKAQRKRIRVSKIANLKDEVGDIIQIPHPYTNNPIKIFITNLKRSYKQTTGKDKGYFLDDIEGWVV